MADETREVPIILYKYEPSRSGDCVTFLLEGRHSDLYLMVDGYSGYNKLTGVHKCCCYAHIRRYFFEAIPKGHEQDFTNPAVQAVLYCNKHKERVLSFHQIYKRRLKDEKPIVEAFLCWAKKQTLTKGSGLDKALTLYQKYTYEDICRLLNWEKNEVPLNIGKSGIGGKNKGSY